MQICVNTVYVPTKCATYTDDTAQKTGHLRPGQRQEINTNLKAVDEEEARGLRLFVSGKITEPMWNDIW